MNIDQRIKNRLDAKLSRLNKLRPLPPEIVRKLREELQVEMTYNSNAIEGNSLTLRETFLILHEGITIKGKNLKEHLEVKNHAEALSYLYDMVGTKRKIPLTEKLIRDLHSLVVKDDEYAEPGRYRSVDVRIAGSKHAPPHGYLVASKMRDLIGEYAALKRKKLHTIEIAALIHHRLVAVHPFVDGNGRTTRLVTNVLLMQEGWPLSIVLKNDRKKYYRLLQESDKGNSKGFTNFIAQSVERSLDIYLNAVEKSTKGSGLEPLSRLAPKTPYSSEYLSLLARQGKIEAHKDGRNWVTTLGAIERYRSARERQR